MSKGTKLSLLLISMTILLMAALMSGMIQSDHWRINQIALSAQYKRVNSEQVRITVAAHPQRSFFKVKPEVIRDNLMQIPWVQQVSVNKKWPDSLIIKIIEHKAVAVWNQDKLLNEKGEIFEVDSIDDLTALPHITGMDQNSQHIWEKYNRFNNIVKSTGFDIKAADISQRGSWQLNLSNGMSIHLGTQQIDAKLVRLTDTWRQLYRLKEQTPEHIDLRYTNGYVVKWAQPKPDITEQTTQEANTNG